MSQMFNIAILGASGTVGEAMREALEEREFPVDNLYLLETEDCDGKSYRFNGKTVRVQNVEDFDWSQVHIAFFAVGNEISERWAAVAGDDGVVVIDNSEQYRYEYDVPLVVPEINPDAIADFRNRNIIANPDSATTQMLVALKPIYDEVGIDRVNVTTYQSVSGAGKQGIDELAGQTAKLLNGLPAESVMFSQQIAFNCIPQVGEFLDNGYTKEEMKMVWETQKIFNDSNLMVNPTCVYVPVFYGHAEALHIETSSPIGVEQVTQLLEQTDSIEVYSGLDFPTQVRDSNGKDTVLVGRIREDISHHSGINLWVVADNVRKGTAVNAVQIAELLVRDYL